MSPKQTWHQWLRGLVERFGTAHECAVFLGVDESKLSRWGRAYFQEPTAMDLERIADRTHTPLSELCVMVWAAKKDREALTLRPTMGGRRPAASLSPVPPRAKRSRRGKLAAWLLVAGSAGALGQPLRVEASRLITDLRVDDVPSRGILSRSRRRPVAA